MEMKAQHYRKSVILARGVLVQKKWLQKRKIVGRTHKNTLNTNGEKRKHRVGTKRHCLDFNVDTSRRRLRKEELEC